MVYNQSIISSQHKGMLRFTHSNETLNEVGEYQNNYSYALSMSFGLVDTEISVSREVNSNVLENEPIDITFETQLQVKSLGIPIIGKYRFGKKALALTVKAGIQASKIIDTKFDIIATSSEHELVQPNHRPYPPKKIKDT